MYQKAAFPTACKTCRRRGRKCDRTLPTCMSCTERGVLCEGYVMRWVGVAARGKLAGETFSSSSKKGTKRSRRSAPSNSISPFTQQRLRSCRGQVEDRSDSLSETTPARTEALDSCILNKQRHHNDGSPLPKAKGPSPDGLSIIRQKGYDLSILTMPYSDNLRGLIDYCK